MESVSLNLFKDYDELTNIYEVSAMCEAQDGGILTSRADVVLLSWRLLHLWVMHSVSHWIAG